MRIDQTKEQQEKYLGKRSRASTVSKTSKIIGSLALVGLVTSCGIKGLNFVGDAYNSASEQIGRATERMGNSVEDVANSGNSIVGYDDFSFEIPYDSGNLEVEKEENIFTVTLTKDGRVLVVNDTDGDRKLDGDILYTPQGSRQRKIKQYTNDSELAGIVSKGNEILQTGYGVAKKRGYLETIAD